MSKAMDDVRRTAIDWDRFEDPDEVAGAAPQRPTD